METRKVVCIFSGAIFKIQSLFPRYLKKNMSCEEHCQTTKEMATIFDSGDDLEQLLLISKSGENDIELAKRRSSEVKQCVNALAKLAERESKASSVRLQESKESNEAISKLGKEKDTKAATIGKMTAVLGSLENTMRSIDEESSKLRKEKDGIQHQVGVALPNTKYSFSLYSNVTGLRWDYDIDGGQLQGFVTSLRDVRPFSLNVKEHSNHFIANYLWDVIASAKNC